MAENLSPELLAKLKAHAAQYGQTAFEDGDYYYQPDYNSYSFASAESGGSGQSEGVGEVSGWRRVKKGDAKSSRMIDQFTVDGAANGQRADSYTNMAGDLAKFGLAAAGVHGLGTLASGAMNAGMAGAAGGADAAATAAGAGSELGTTGLNAMRAGELAGYATNGALPAGAATAAGSAGTAAASGGGIWNAIQTGASSLLGGGGGGAPGTGGLNWGDLLKTGVALYGVSQAGDNASDATKAATGVANSQIDLNQQALDWYKQVYNDQAPDRKQAADLAKSVADAQIRGMNFATDNAMELANYNKTTFRPVEQRIVTDAMGYDTGERRMSAAASAAADVDTSIASARQAQNRALGRAGIAPGSTKAMALGEDMAVQQGIARGAAKTGAVRNVESMGHARMMDAASLGRSIPSQQATQ